MPAGVASVDPEPISFQESAAPPLSVEIAAVLVAKEGAEPELVAEPVVPVKEADLVPGPGADQNTDLEPFSRMDIVYREAVPVPYPLV